MPPAQSAGGPKVVLMPRFDPCSASKSYMYFGAASAGPRMGPGPKWSTNAPVLSSISTMPPGWVLSVVAPIIVTIARPLPIGMTPCGTT
jgi:hypothetical protein